MNDDFQLRGLLFVIATFILAITVSSILIKAHWAVKTKKLEAEHKHRIELMTNISFIQWPNIEGSDVFDSSTTVVSFKDAFKGCEHLEKVPTKDALTDTTPFSQLFAGCKYLK